MDEEEQKVNGMSCSIVDGSPKSSVRSTRKHRTKKEKIDEELKINGENPVEDNPKSRGGIEETTHSKRKKALLKKAINVDGKREIDRLSPSERRNLKSNNEREKRRKNKRKKGLLNESDKAEEEQKRDGESISGQVNPKFSDVMTGNKIDETENGKEVKEQDVNLAGLGEEKQERNKEMSESRESKKKQRLLEEAAKAYQRGICYLSRIPPHMDPVRLRQILSQYGEIQRIYLAPEDSANRVPRKRENPKRDGGFQERGFSEGWVEFTKKSVAKRVANMLNGEQIGGRKRSSFYYDLWNINYLSKFKWDDLTAEIAYKNAIREQKLALEISAAKRERDFYLSKVDQSRALSSIEERIKKKQKVQQESQTHSDSQQVAKMIRQFPQKKPVADNAAEAKPRLSKDVLAGVFGGS